MLEIGTEIGIKEIPARTIDQYAQMLTFSMGIGQGIRNPQYNALRYIKGRHPDLAITDEDFPSVRAATKNLVYPMFFPNGVPRYDVHITEHNSLHTNHTATGGMIMKETVDRGITDDLKKMQEIFAGEPEDPKALLPTVTEGVLKRDFHYLVEPGTGRLKAPTSEDNKAFFKDNWGSFFLQFVLRGRSTGVPEFNEMFADIKEYLKEQRIGQTEEWEKHLEPQITKIVASHNGHHPRLEDQFTPADLDAALVSSNQ